MKRFSGLSVILVSIALCAQDSEQEKKAYIFNKAVPLIKEFLNKNHLPYESGFDTNKIDLWRVDYSEKRGYEPVKVFTFIGYDKKWYSCTREDTNGIIVNVYDDQNPSIARIMTRSNPEELRLLATKRNLLSEQTALDLAKYFFSMQGHKEGDFDPVVFEQYTWGDQTNPTEFLRLPFYEARWYIPGVANERGSTANLKIIISGLKSNMVYYSYWPMK